MYQTTSCIYQITLNIWVSIVHFFTINRLIVFILSDRWDGVKIQKLGFDFCCNSILIWGFKETNIILHKNKHNLNYMGDVIKRGKIRCCSINLTFLMASRWKLCAKNTDCNILISHTWFLKSYVKKHINIQ